MRSSLRFPFLLSTCAVLLPSNLFGQVIHIPPVLRPGLPHDAAVLVVSMTEAPLHSSASAGPVPGADDATGNESDRAGGVGDLKGATIAVQDNQIVIVGPNNRMDVIPIAGRKIKDVMHEMQVIYGESLTIKSDYPLYEASILSSSNPQPLQGGVTIHAASESPLLGFSFGAVFALSDSPSEKNSLLSDAGFQLDLVGNYQFATPGDNHKHFLADWWTAQARLGINANQQLSVQTQGTASGVPESGPGFGAALQQADQISITGQVDMTFPLSGDHMDLVITPVNYGVSWTQLDPFVFPLFQVGDTLFPAESLFQAPVVESAREALQRVLPLSEIGPQAVFQFRANKLPVFYFGGGVLWKESPIRRVLFDQPDSTRRPASTSLEGLFKTPMQGYWRAMLGARLAGVLDVRVDAAGPFKRRNGDPILRLLLGHAFSVAGGK